MKRSSLLLAIGACVTLAGCATSGGTQSHVVSKAVSDVDVGKVVAVNQWAQAKGYTVVWVSYPQRLRLSDDTSAKN
jgi:ABC-type glycerol-3-phosphate transport system substrate-binding protein